jgi:hypothetical protein
VAIRGETMAADNDGDFERVGERDGVKLSV